MLTMINVKETTLRFTLTHVNSPRTKDRPRTKMYREENLTEKVVALL